MRFLGSVDHRYIPTTNGMTLVAGVRYRVLNGHTVVFPATMEPGQVFEMIPDSGNWSTSGITFSHPSTLTPASVNAIRGVAQFVAGASNTLELHIAA